MKCQAFYFFLKNQNKTLKMSSTEVVIRALMVLATPFEKTFFALLFIPNGKSGLVFIDKLCKLLIKIIML